MVKVQRRHYEKTMQDLYDARSKHKKLKKKYDTIKCTLQRNNKLNSELKQQLDKFRGKLNGLKGYTWFGRNRQWKYYTKYQSTCIVIIKCGFDNKIISFLLFCICTLWGIGSRKVNDVHVHIFFNFWSDLPLELFRNEKTYNREQKRFALTLHLYGPKSYEFLRSTFHNKLPAPRTLSL